MALALEPWEITEPQYQSFETPCTIGPAVQPVGVTQHFRKKVFFCAMGLFCSGSVVKLLQTQNMGMSDFWKKKCGISSYRPEETRHLAIKDEKGLVLDSQVVLKPKN